MVDLTDQEQVNARAALRFLRARFGGWEPLARALRSATKYTQTAGNRGRVSASLAFRVARLAGVGVDDVLQGRFPPPGTCPHCGAPMLPLPDGAAQERRAV